MIKHNVVNALLAAHWATSTDYGPQCNYTDAMDDARESDIDLDALYSEASALTLVEIGALLNAIANMWQGEHETAQAIADSDTTLGRFLVWCGETYFGD